MCGIAGIFNIEKKVIPRAVIRVQLEKMMKVIKHRGPDDDGIHVDKTIGLGSTRLSIIDLSAKGHMPMIDEETKNRIVHNGEIYNYRELRHDLERCGVDFKSNTDTETILKAYARYGKDCLRYFNGMFAFVIWDPRKDELFCVRDRIGIKPFFYSVDNGRFYFASEIKALLAVGIKSRPNLKIIHDYLVSGIYDHSEDTFFDGIKQIPPGHMLIVNKAGAKLEKYWGLEPDIEYPGNHVISSNGLLEEYQDSFLELLEDSIKLRLRSDVPIAVHVSGGLDSTLILAIINKVNGGQGRIKAFSYYFADTRYDERPFVKELTDALLWKDIEYCPVLSSDVPNLTLEAMYSQEQPFPGIITLAKHKLIKESRNFGAKVILEGQGGDEIAAGYQYHFGSYILDLIQSGNSELAYTEISDFGKVNALDTKTAVSKTLDGLASYYKMGRSADGSAFTKKDCLNKDFLSCFARKTDFPAYFRSNLLNMQYRDIFHTKLPRILRSCDRASMAFGKELRVPLLDHRICEFAFGLPGSVKIKNGIQRYFMREAAKSFSSNRLYKLPKRAVVDPQREWLKNDLSGWVCDILNSKSFRDRGLFDQKETLKEYETYKTTDNNFNSFYLWQWISMEIWYRTFID